MFKFKLDKKKIFSLYLYFLFLEEENFLKEEWATRFFIWKKSSDQLIEKKLKKGWTLQRINPLEKAIIFYSAWEIEERKEFYKLIIVLY